MKKAFSLVAAALLALTACQESLEDRCAKEAKTYTEKNCPAKLDENLVIDSMTFDRATHTIHYYYKLTGAADTLGVLTPETVRPVLLAELKNSTSMKAFKDAGYSFAYSYRSQKRPDTLLIDLKFTEEDYNK